MYLKSNLLSCVCTNKIMSLHLYLVEDGLAVVN